MKEVKNLAWTAINVANHICVPYVFNSEFVYATNNPNPKLSGRPTNLSVRRILRRSQLSMFCYATYSLASIFVKNYRVI